MMMVIKKKQLVVAALAIVIGTAGYINAGRKDGETQVGQKYLGEAQLVGSGEVSQVDEGALETQSNFFAQARLDREAGRSRSIETFNSIISNESAAPEAKASAQQGVLELAQNTETETAVENLLREKGFEDAVCYINNGMANVVVKTELLDSAGAAKISEIVMQQSGIPQEKIKIMEMN
ncbi:MAG: SpoIIIAH-like family protein [Clostridia bacterium]|nr:SpoIIIAH-like family protein [Clostridia bacterium]